MSEVTTIGFDLFKNVYQIHGIERIVNDLDPSPMPFNPPLLLDVNSMPGPNQPSEALLRPCLFQFAPPTFPFQLVQIWDK